MKVVLDTNVLVSGLMYPRSVPGIAVAAWRDGRFDLVMTLAQLEEVGRVLAYPKIRRILRWDDGEIGSFLRHLYLRAEIVDPEVPRAALRDRDDLHVLAPLSAGMADLLVTGDADLLALQDRHAMETPADFAKRLK